MNTNTTLSKGSWIQLNERHAARAGILLLLLLMLPAVAQAQFTYTDNGDGTATITGYTGPGGAVDMAIPYMINGLPVTRIGDSAFYNGAAPLPYGLTSVTIPDSVTNIGFAAFAWQGNLRNVTLGNGLASIGAVAFADCGLTTITIPGGVTNIGERAFADCGSLTGVYFEGNAPSLGGSDVFQGDQNTVYYEPGTTGWGPTYGGRPTALWSPSGYLCTTNSGTFTITGYTGPGGAVTIPDTISSLPVTSIGNNAFYNCGNLTSITIPNSITNIGSWAFYFCQRLTNVTIPSSVTSIGNQAFVFCTRLSAITVDVLNPAYSSVDGVLFNKMQTSLIQCPGAKAGTYTVSNSVTNIWDNAFAGCGLANVTIPDSVIRIGDYAFDGCTGLTHVTIPNSVTSIGNEAFYVCTGLTHMTIPNSVTNIGNEAFDHCTSLTNVTIGKSVTSIGDYAFNGCTSLTSVTIPDSVTSIGYAAFSYCTSLTSATIGKSVTSIGEWGFGFCTNLTGVYFQGDTPSLGGSSVLAGDRNATVYYLPETSGWGATFGGCPTALWVQVPTIQSSPLTQTAETGSAVGLWVDASSPLPLFYLWYLNYTNLVSWSTNRELEITSLQLSQSGAYTVVVSNVLGAVTSAPAMLNVVAAVERRPVPGVKVTGEVGSLLNVDYADSLSTAPSWTTLNSVNLSSTSQYCFDLTLPLPPQRFYRAWQTGTPSVLPSLSLPGMVPAITLTGNMGGSVRLDYINQFGPIDAWFTLDTVALTNTSQLYFDVSTLGQPQRLYRLVPLP